MSGCPRVLRQFRGGEHHDVQSPEAGGTARPTMAYNGDGGYYLSMGPLGTQEIVVIFILALLLFGPKKLPELGRTVAKAMKEFRKAQSELKSTFDREMQNLEREVNVKELTATSFQSDSYNYDYSSYDSSYYDGSYESATTTFDNRCIRNSGRWGSGSASNRSGGRFDRKRASGYRACGARPGAGARRERTFRTWPSAVIEQAGQAAEKPVNS